MFKREEKNGAFLGWSTVSGKNLFFFGSKNLTRDMLPKHFPEFQFAFLKQVHGKTVVKADARQNLEADAHFTSQKNLALVVQSADCVPILLGDEDKVCAIHSGWRSSALNIVAEAKRVGGSFATAAIGPHILRESFEVGLDVSQQLLKAAPLNRHSQLVYPHEDPTKVRFDLTELIRRQLQSSFGENLRLHECLTDTKTSPELASFRRDRDRAGRQLSFIVMKD